MDNEIIVRRIKEYLGQVHMTASALAKKIGFNQSNLSKILRNERAVPANLIAALVDNAGINRTWLLNGEGDMLVNDDPPNNEVTPLIRQRNGIPLVSQYAYAGYLTGYADAEYMDSLPIVDFTPDREMTGNWLAFEVRGDSMDNGSREAYCQGDIVITREVKPHLWRDSKLHIHRRDFVIVHEEGILIKRIIDHDVEHHTITIHSLNPDYPDRVIDLAQVRKIFSIVESRQNRAR